MNENQANPYAMNQAVPAAEAAVNERAVFLQKTYTWLLMGILGFCATIWGVQEIPALQSMAWSIASNWIIAIVVMMGGAMVVHAVAEKPGINAIAFAGYAFVFGLLVGPWVMIADSQGAGIVGQAAMITAVIFFGLTAYVFVSGKDFSFMGGILSIVLFTMIAVGLCAWLVGFALGTWFAVLGAMLFSGYILYDTSRILHHYPVTAHVSAAAVLFVNVVLLFKYILVLMMNRD
ncbi:MAG: Bax inhibitor-1/YccA family protein [Planctomycetota bacterium]|jgi:FtsH-binding integral membrane protein